MDSPMDYERMTFFMVVVIAVLVSFCAVMLAYMAEVLDRLDKHMRRHEKQAIEEASGDLGPLQHPRPSSEQQGDERESSPGRHRA